MKKNNRGLIITESGPYLVERGSNHLYPLAVASIYMDNEFDYKRGRKKVQYYEIWVRVEGDNKDEER